MRKWNQSLMLSVLMISCAETSIHDRSEDISSTSVDSAEEPVEEPIWAEEMKPEDVDVIIDINGSKSSEEEFDICSLASQEPVVHALPTSEEEAAQLVLIPGAGENYLLNKPEGEEGWFVLEVPSWMCDVHLYTDEGVEIELAASADWELGAVAEAMGECDDSGMYLYSWTFHAWGSYIVHIKAPETQDLWLASVLVSSH